MLIFPSPCFNVKQGLQLLDLDLLGAGDLPLPAQQMERFTSRVEIA